MKKKILKSTLLTLLLTLLFSFNVFAAGFTQDDSGIHYLKDDGTYVTSSWVEVNNLWFMFDANGICVNPTGSLAPNDADGLYQIVTSYTPFVTADATLLNQCLANGTVVAVDGQYFLTPESATILRNANRATAIAPQTDSTDTSQTVNPDNGKQPVNPDNGNQSVEPEPNANPSGQMVWLSATGSKYHSIDNCGRMNPKKARLVTLEEALSLGMDQCSKCW